MAAEARRRMLQMNLRKQELDTDVDLAELGHKIDGYSGSDIKCLCMYVA